MMLLSSFVASVTLVDYQRTFKIVVEGQRDVHKLVGLLLLLQDRR
jgi:hypothetical protein